MNKFTDEYFKNKVEKIFSQYPHHSGEDIEKEIYIALKEVARDVRHACAEVSLSVNIDESQKYEDDLFGNERETQFYDGFEFAKTQIHKKCMNL